METEEKKELLAQALREYPTWGHAYIAERGKNAELIIANKELSWLLAQLLAFEFPKQSWRQHPSPKGKALWSRVERMVHGS